MMYLLSCIFIARMINNIETSRNKSKRVGVRAIDKTMIGVSSAAIMQNTGYVVVVVGFIIVFHVNFDEFSSLLSVIWSGAAEHVAHVAVNIVTDHEVGIHRGGLVLLMGRWGSSHDRGGGAVLLGNDTGTDGTANQLVKLHWIGGAHGYLCYGCSRCEMRRCLSMLVFNATCRRNGTYYVKKQQFKFRYLYNNLAKPFTTVCPFSISSQASGPRHPKFSQADSNLKAYFFFWNFFLKFFLYFFFFWNFFFKFFLIFFLQKRVA
jgi:hypothetical protein